LLIAQLALISSKGIEIMVPYSDGSTGKKYKLEIPVLLRQMDFFPINEYDHSFQYRFPLTTAADLLENQQREELIQLLLNTALYIPIVRIFELIKDYVKKLIKQLNLKLKIGIEYPILSVTVYIIILSLQLNQEIRKRMIRWLANYLLFGKIKQLQKICLKGH
jgi:hypothetical protein